MPLLLIDPAQLLFYMAWVALIGLSVLCLSEYVKLVDRVPAVLIDDLGVSLQDARGRVTHHLSYEKIRLPSCAQSAGEGGPEVIDWERFDSCQLQRRSPTLLDAFDVY